MKSPITLITFGVNDMSRAFFAIAVIVLYAMTGHAEGHNTNEAGTPSQYILLNGQSPENAERNFREIDSTFGKMGDRRIVIGVGYSLRVFDPIGS